ncbi:MAG: 2-oxoacid:acceptor oxidoreductase family protein [Paludibacteraceae bacterium]
MTEHKDVVIRFCGDSGDGMQLVGTMFSNIMSRIGYQVFTYPSYPADMRAPKDSLSGVSSFQVHFGDRVSEPGDAVDVLVCLNPASYKTNYQSVRAGGIVIYDESVFDERRLTNAQMDVENPFATLSSGSTVWPLPVTAQCAVLDAAKARNVYLLGCLCYYLDVDETLVQNELDCKFGKKQIVLETNTAVLQAAYNFCTNLQIDKYPVVHTATAEVSDASKLTLLSGCQAACRGLMKAADAVSRKLFLGSYPITPATDILIELEKQRKNGVIAVQAEDEIAGCSMAVGASFGGLIGVTSTSGPGMCLKSEAINLAVMAELPLVIVDVMRGGPSTGLPTKTEQSDLNIALYGRSGDSPLPVLAAMSPADCYVKAYEAVKIAVENMTPVVLLMDAYIGNGLEMTDLQQPMSSITVSPSWTSPGDAATKILGGSEVDKSTLTITADAQNHIKNTEVRVAKIAKIAVPDMHIDGAGDTVLCGWGSTKGKIEKIAILLRRNGIDVATVHFDHLAPLPQNIDELNRRKRIIVIEQSMHQFADLLLQSGIKQVTPYCTLNCEPLNAELIANQLKKQLQ